MSAPLLQSQFFWAYNDVSQATVGAWLDVDTKRTLPDWFNMHRDLCIDWMRAHPKQIDISTDRVITSKMTTVTVLVKYSLPLKYGIRSDFQEKHINFRKDMNITNEM